MKKILSLVLLFLCFVCSGVKAQEPTPSPTWEAPCVQIPWTPTDGSGANPPLTFTVNTSDGVYNSTYCRVGNRVWIQSLFQFPSTTDTNKAKVNLPFPTTGYDTAITIGVCLGPVGGFCSQGGYALVSPGSWLKFFQVGGQAPAVPNSTMSGVLVLVSGSYLTNAP